MTIDERLEALAQSLELMAAMQRDSDARREARMAEQDARMAALTEKVDQASESVKQMSEKVNQMSDAILVTSVRRNVQENGIEEHKKRLDEMERFQYRTERNLADATEKLNALIAAVDGIVRDRKPNGQP